MNAPEQKADATETKTIRNDKDATIPNDAVIEEKETKERERLEKEVIEKAVAFWNHPSMRDVPPAEKRSYLHEQQGLTNAQIHKVWEEMVRVGTNDSIINNSNAPQSGPRHPHHHHHRYNNHPYSSHLPTNTSHGQDFSATAAPYPPSSASNYGYDYNGHHAMSGRQHPPTPPMSNNNDSAMDGGDGSISIARGLSLLGVGGFLGVTGAAAVRWLNGGRFELLPSHPIASRISTSESTGPSLLRVVSDEQQRKQSSVLQENREQDEGNKEVEECAHDRTQWNIDGANNNLDNANDYDEEDEYNGEDYSNHDEDFDTEGYLLERIDALLSSIDSNSALQERLILKLANTSTITDDSMSLLKQNIDFKNHKNNKESDTTGTTAGDNIVSIELREVKDGLVGLCESMLNDLASKTGHEIESEKKRRDEYSELLAKFENCIQALEKPVESFVLDSDAVDNKSTSTSETTATEDQGRQYIQSLSAAPSTPAAEVGNKSRISSMASSPTSIPLLSLNDCILKLVEKNNTASLKSGSQLLYLYLANLSGKPDNRRYRKIHTSNESFQKVATLIGGKDLLLAVGFVEESDKGVLEWVPTGSTEKEISALVLVKEATTALGVLRKPDNVPSSELIRSALSKLTPSSSFPVPHSSPQQLDDNEEDNDSDNHHHNYHVQDDVPLPQTPAGSSLLSPPMPKKLPFVPTPSDRT